MLAVLSPRTFASHSGERRIGHPHILKSALPKNARVTPATCPAAFIRIVTRVGQSVIHAQRQTSLDDLPLCPSDQRRMDTDRMSFHSRLRCQSSHMLKRRDV